MGSWNESRGDLRLLIFLLPRAGITDIANNEDCLFDFLFLSRHTLPKFLCLKVHSLPVFKRGYFWRQGLEYVALTSLEFAVDTRLALSSNICQPPPAFASEHKDRDTHLHKQHTVLTYLLIYLFTVDYYWVPMPYMRICTYRSEASSVEPASPPIAVWILGMDGRPLGMCDKPSPAEPSHRPHMRFSKEWSLRERRKENPKAEKCGRENEALAVWVVFSWKAVEKSPPCAKHRSPKIMVFPQRAESLQCGTRDIGCSFCFWVGPRCRYTPHSFKWSRTMAT